MVCWYCFIIKVGFCEEAEEDKTLYQETEKFEKYGKLFVPLVGGALLLPFVAAVIASASPGDFAPSSFWFIAILVYIFVFILLALVLGNGMILSSIVRHTAKKVCGLPFHFDDSHKGDANGGQLFIDVEDGVIVFISAFNPFKIQIFSAARVDKARTIASPMFGIRYVFELDGKKVSMYTAAIDDHVIHLRSDEGKKAVEEADRYVAYLQEAKWTAEQRGR